MRNKGKETNQYADKVKELYANDSLITRQYHQLNNGKWNHLMSQTHIGYTYWQQPDRQKMPAVHYLPSDSTVAEEAFPRRKQTGTDVRSGQRSRFYQDEKRGISIEADHYTKAVSTNGITWKVLPDHGRTGSAITPFPVTASEQKPGGSSPHLQYDVVTEMRVSLRSVPTFRQH